LLGEHLGVLLGEQRVATCVGKPHRLQPALLWLPHLQPAPALGRSTLRATAVPY